MNRQVKKNKLYFLITALFLAVFIFSGCSDYSDKNYNDKTETFSGYECTGDCSGHKAGYDWAERKGITDPDDCGGNSNSFIEGCKSYAEEQ